MFWSKCLQVPLAGEPVRQDQILVRTPKMFIWCLRCRTASLVQQMLCVVVGHMWLRWVVMETKSMIKVVVSL